MNANEVTLVAVVIETLIFEPVHLSYGEINNLMKNTVTMLVMHSETAPTNYSIKQKKNRRKDFISSLA